MRCISNPKTLSYTWFSFSFSLSLYLDALCVFIPFSLFPCTNRSTLCSRINPRTENQQQQQRTYVWTNVWTNEMSVYKNSCYKIRRILHRIDVASDTMAIEPNIQQRVPTTKTTAQQQQQLCATYIVHSAHQITTVPFYGEGANEIQTHSISYKYKTIHMPVNNVVCLCSCFCFCFCLCLLTACHI